MSNRNKVIIGIVILLGTLALGIWQGSQMRAHSIAVDALNTTAANLTVEQKKLIGEYQDVKVEVTDSRERAEQSLALVFPTSEDLTNLTRLFDDFAAKNNFKTNPFFISTITYQNAQDTDDDYRIVPVNMSVESSRKNLSKFLEFVENSGSLEGETRLMTIEDMTVSYPQEEDSTYSVRLLINAYFSREI